MHSILVFLSSLESVKQGIVREIAEALGQEPSFEIEYGDSLSHAQTYLDINPRTCAVLYDFDDGGFDISTIVQRVNPRLPIFAFTSKDTELEVDLDILNTNLHFIYYKSHQTESSIARIRSSINAYFEDLMPPFTKALFEYAEKNIYSYCTPGHAGGSAFLKSPIGARFYDFYGSNIFKSDISISVADLGALLDHSGKHEEAEEFIAAAYGSDYAYMVTNGTSTSNKIIGMHSLYDGASILVDRNCHKSIAHLLMMCNVTPIYFQPTRNCYGIMGGISKQQFTQASIDAKIKKLSAHLKRPVEFPILSVITNSTYDGFLYETRVIKDLLPVKNIHFDAAWIAYAPFHPIYSGYYGLSGPVPEGKVIYESYSTHKMLSAFSQAATIQVKGAAFDKDAFNDSFMMHTSTSPFYPIVASIETATAMMHGRHGELQMQEALKEAFQFRQEVETLRLENCQKDKGWFYDILQPETIGKTLRCFSVADDDNWHGFDNVESMGHMALDPLKITLITPGLNPDGTYNELGIPACLVAKFLDYQNIVVEKTGPYSLLFLFGLASDRSRSLKLLNDLATFKRGFDQNLKIEKILPNLYQEAPRFYKKYTIQRLALELHELYIQNGLCESMDAAYEALPKMVLTPYEARQYIVKRAMVKTELSNLCGKVVAEMILPYPPGIPLLFPGEMVTEESMQIIMFLQTLCQTGEAYPGFETSIHGIYYDDALGYYTYTIDQAVETDG